MALSDFTQERRLVEYGGRRYSCRKPSLVTMTRLLSMYVSEVGSLRETLAEHEGKADPLDMLSLFCNEGDPRAAAVLTTCVDLIGGSPGEAEGLIAQDALLATDLATAVLALTDVGRIVESLDFSEAEGPALPESLSGPSEQELSIVLLAERFGVPPHDVPLWPYEEFLTICEAMGQLHPRPGQEVATHEWLTPENNDLPGVVAERASEDG